MVEGLSAERVFNMLDVVCDVIPSVNAVFVAGVWKKVFNWLAASGRTGEPNLTFRLIAGFA